MLRFHTARGDFVTDYLASLVAQIRCESREGLKKWQERLPAPSAQLPESPITPLFREVAQDQRKQRVAIEAARVTRKIQKDLDDQSEIEWSVVAMYEWDGHPLPEKNSLEWADQLIKTVTASLMAGKRKQLDALINWGDDVEIRQGCRLTAKLAEMAVAGGNRVLIAAHLREIVDFNELREGFHIAGENMRTGGPFPHPPKFGEGSDPSASRTQTERESALARARRSYFPKEFLRTQILSTF